MKHAATAALLILGVALIASGAYTASDEIWLAAGVVTKISGGTFYLLTQDNNVYEINGSRAEVLVGEMGTQCCEFAVGDRVRVYGVKMGPKQINAERIRVLTGETAQKPPEPEKMVKIVIEKPALQAAPAAGQEMERPEPTWTGQGLITGINYTGRQITVRTSNGAYKVNVARSLMLNGTVRIGFGDLSQGDAVRITGDLNGFYTVDARTVTVLRTHSEAESQVPQYPVSITGYIQSVDYASFTFRMSTEALSIVVMADQNTPIQEFLEKMAFMDLKPGMKIKMSGYGSPATGYMAQHIMIIGTAP